MRPQDELLMRKSTALAVYNSDSKSIKIRHSGGIETEKDLSLGDWTVPFRSVE